MTRTSSFVVKRGDSFRQKITVSCDGAVVNITGWTIYFTVKVNKSDPDEDAVISKKITEHIDAENGESLLLVLPTETDNLLGRHYYDIQIKRPITEPQEYDDIQTPLEGLITFAEDITRSPNSDE